MTFFFNLLCSLFDVHWTPVHVAAANNSREVLKVLLTMADCNLCDLEGESPLHCAARYGYIPILKVLLHAKGINVNIKDAEGATPLHWAVSHDQPESVAFLAKAPGVDINIADAFHRTPLMVSIFLERFDCAKILLEQEGIDINSPDAVSSFFMMELLLSSVPLYVEASKSFKNSQP